MESGKGKGVDGSLDCGTELKGKTVKGVNACKTNDNNPESFDVDLMGDAYSTGCDPEDAQCSIETASKYWELESTDTSNNRCAGEVKQNLSFWKDILHAPPSILDCVECGYHLPLKFLPLPNAQNNHTSAKEHREFVNVAVNNLVVNRCARKVKEKPYLCNPLLVVKSYTGKLRLVLNLKYLNQFLKKIQF